MTVWPNIRLPRRRHGAIPNSQLGKYRHKSRCHLLRSPFATSHPAAAQVTSTLDCDGTDVPECCKPSSKPAFLQFKLPVSAAMAAKGTDPRFNALAKLQRCRLSYARTTTRSLRRMAWKFTNQDGDAVAAGNEPNDARYATIPLNFAKSREVTMCLYTADTATDVDCSWENIWWVAGYVRFDCRHKQLRVTGDRGVTFVTGLQLLATILFACCMHCHPLHSTLRIGEPGISKSLSCSWPGRRH